MFSVRQWWSQHRSQFIILILLLVTAWVIRQTQAFPIYELYYWLTRPLEIVQTQRDDEITNARIKELEQRIEELEQQNQKLKEWEEYHDNQPESLKTAPIIGRSADHWWQQLTVGIGRNQGVKEGDVVTGIGGLVGRVQQVTPNTSLVLLISDPNVRVGVIVSRSRNMGVMSGQGNHQGVMEFFNTSPDVEPGDSIITSPASQLYPPGIPVGEVTKVDLEQSPSPEAIVELNVPIKTLEWVSIHTDQEKKSTNIDYSKAN